MCIILYLLMINLVQQYNEALINLRFHSPDKMMQRMSLLPSSALSQSGKESHAHQCL